VFSFQSSDALSTQFITANELLLKGEVIMSQDMARIVQLALIKAGTANRPATCGVDGGAIATWVGLPMSESSHKCCL
jgi:hypothetical protein